MTKNYRAQIVTVLVLVALVTVGVARKSRWRVSEPQAGQDPQDAIYAMLGAARSGDTKTYLASFSGPMEAALRQTITESTEPGFAKYLRDSHAAIKGVAVSDPEKTPEGQAKVRVEYIYQDRNEAQVMYLEKGPRGWKISRADGDERVKTLIPYGTPVK
jgi:hypothetical protein